MYTHPEGRAFSLLSIGGPSFNLICATAPKVICCPEGVRIGSCSNAGTESRSSRDSER